MTGTPVAEVPIDTGLVRALLESQHPDLAHLDLEAVDAGWDNAMFRLGDDLAVRMPRRELAAPCIRNEQVWLPRLAPRLPIPVPVAIREGRPELGYPWYWSVVPWFAGRPADLTPPGTSEADRLGGFLRVLHRPAPADAPDNPYRGVPLPDRAATFRERVERLEDAGVDTSPALTAWADATAAPGPDDRVWLHGDLHPGNLLVSDGRIVAVIDWGDLTAGDRAADLGVAWLAFDTTTHGTLKSAYGPAPNGTWERAKGWAALFATMLLDTGLVDDPRFETVGRRALERLAAR